MQVNNANNVKIESCRFYNYTEGNSSQSASLHLVEVDHASVSSTNFTDNTTSMKLLSVPHFQMSGGTIKNTLNYITTSGSIGIHVPGSDNNTNLFLDRNATIKHQDFGIKIDKGGVLDGTNTIFGRVSMDCARLIENGKGIRGEDITMEIDALVHCNCTDLADAKPNTFTKLAIRQGNPRYFDICYTDITVPNNTISAQGNYWAGENGSDYILKDCAAQNNTLNLLNNISWNNSSNRMYFRWWSNATFT